MVVLCVWVTSLELLRCCWWPCIWVIPPWLEYLGFRLYGAGGQRAVGLVKKLNFRVTKTVDFQVISFEGVAGDEIVWVYTLDESGVIRKFDGKEWEVLWPEES